MRISAAAAAEGAQLFMRRSLCVGDRGQFACGDCGAVMHRQPTTPHCPMCEIKWVFILPAFVYYAAQAVQCGVKKADEDLCFKVAANLGGLIYEASPELAAISPFARPGYDSRRPWVLS